MQLIRKRNYTDRSPTLHLVLECSHHSTLKSSLSNFELSNFQCATMYVNDDRYDYT